jgi:diacylglycerol kinase family enzyme
MHDARIERLVQLLRPVAEVQCFVAQGVQAIPQVLEHALATRPDAIVPGGGDGTVHAVLNAAGSSAEVCWLFAPLGGSNDLARKFGHKHIEDLVHTVRNGQVTHIDRCSARITTESGQVEHTFVSSAGVGFVPALFQVEGRRAGAALKRVLGDGAYPFLALYNAFTYRGVDATVTLDGTVHQGSLSLLEVAKVDDTGGIRITPSGQLTGGWFDVCWIDRIGWRSQVGALADILRVRHTQRVDTTWFTDDPSRNKHGQAAVSTVGVTTTPPQPVHLHGEVLGTTPVEFKVHPDALRVWSA